MRELVLAFIGSLCPAVLFNVERKKLLWVGLTGAVGWIVYVWLYSTTGRIVFSTFIGAVAVGICSESFARILKSPAIVFSVTGIFPLVPGIGAYNTVQFIVENKLMEAASKAIETLASAGAIAIGIMLISAIFRVVSRLKDKKTYTPL